MGGVRRRWRARALWGLVATLVSAVAVVAGVLISAPSHPNRPPLATSLSSLDTTTVAVRRGPFCTSVHRRDVTAALGASIATTDAWRNGDTTGLDDASSTKTDVVDEYGCRWSGGDNSAAAWVFAPPVTVERANELIASAKATKGCTPIPGAAAFGDPSVAVKCTRDTDGSSSSSDYLYAGLFGDAWLTCSLQSTSTRAGKLADHWCASVINAAEVVTSTP